MSTETVHTVTTPKPEVPVGPKTSRFPLPSGVVTPIELRNFLVEQGYAAESLKPQQAYAWVKNPGKTNPFPVKFYEEDGTVHDTQPGGLLTRPGIPSMQEGVDWFMTRATAKPAAAEAHAEEGGQDEAAADEPAEDDEHFEEAE
jgi:hypothetical protein